MIGKSEARRIIVAEAAHGRRLEEVPLPLAFGRVLAKDARSDLDLPPFEKSSMDGWAVRSQDVARAPATLRVLGAIAAGSVANKPVGPGETWKIMTGAPMPEGADAVVIVEESELQDGGRAVLLRKGARPWQNVCRQGEDVRKGDVVLPAGTPLDAGALALLSSIGCDPAPTFAPPRVCIVPTGDELVDAAGPPPGPGQIRESNGILLEAQVRQVSAAIPTFRPGIARDSRESLGSFLDVGCDHDVLILSGGVSMGDLDLVGAELKRRGLHVLVEKVSIKPGKPLLFGWLDRADGGRCAVFGLPGNPVSSFVTFELFARPFLLRRLGHEDAGPEVVRATLETDREVRIIPRTQHLPATLWCGEDGRLRARPLEWHGSADLRGLADANALIVVDPDAAAAPRAGDLVAVERLANREAPAGEEGPRTRMRTFVRDLFWVLLSCGLWAAAFPPLDLWPLAWVALVPAFVRTASAGDPPQPGSRPVGAPGAGGKRRLGLVWVIAQYFLHAALMGWTGVIAPLLAFLVPLLGIPFSWLTGFLLSRGIVRLKLPILLVGPLVIVCVEVLRDQALTGLSWASIGYSQWRWSDLLQLASAGRVHLMSLVVLVANAGLATAIVRWRAGAGTAARVRPVALAALLVALAALLGRASRPSGFEEGPLAAGLQPNISQAQRLKDRGREGWIRHLKNHAELVDQVRDLKPDLLVYSETSFPVLTEPENSLARFLGAELKVPQDGTLPVPSIVLQGPEQVTILGLVRRQRLPEAEVSGPRDDDGDGYDETNVAWVVKGGLPTKTIYEKRGLAPFGEYVPMPRGWPGRDLLLKEIEHAAHFIPDLNPGKEEVLFEAPSPSGPRKGGLTICFEIVFPWYYREAARMGADFHVNISNDAWFDGSSELVLVDAATTFRAVESGRSLLRVSNSGISTLVGPDGTRLAVVEGEGGRRTQVRGTLHGRIPIARGQTTYVRWGDWPWILPCLALFLSFLAATILRLRRALPAR